jgi:hypothetical protein
MYKHTRDHHQIDESTLAATYLGVMATKKLKVADMTELEFNSIKPASHDYFTCNLCDDGKEICVRTCFSHFVKCHGYESDDVKQWLAVKDGGNRRNKSLTRVFPDGYAAYADWLAWGQGEHDEVMQEASTAPVNEAMQEESTGAIDERPEDEDVVAAAVGAVPKSATTKKTRQPSTSDPKVADTSPANIRAFFDKFPGASSSSGPLEAEIVLEGQPPGVHEPPLHYIATQLANIGRALSSKGQIETPVPKLTLKQEVLDWKHGMGVIGDTKVKPRMRLRQPATDKHRNRCPILECDPDPRFDFDAFERYLATSTHQDAKDSRTATVQNVKRFYNTMNIEDGDFTEIGVMCGVYSQNIVQDLSLCDAMDKKYGWGRKVPEALHHYCKHLQILCNKKGNRWPEAKETLQQLIDECLAQEKIKSKRKRDQADVVRQRLDAIRITKFPPTQTIKAAVKLAMVRLHMIYKHCVSKEGTAPRFAIEATTIIVGIICYNAFPGRSGEWCRMLADHVHEQYVNKATYLECREHKTASVYGSLAKHVPPGSWEAFLLYYNLPHKKTGLFLDPPFGGNQVSLSNYLRRFGLLYLGTENPPTSTLIRKYYHTTFLKLSREKSAMKVMEKIDGHTTQTGRRVYCCTTFEDDAELAALLFRELFGEHVAWPTDTEIEELSTQGSIEDIAKSGSALDNHHQFELEDLQDEDHDDFDEQVMHFVTTDVLAIEDVKPPAAETLAIELAPAGSTDVQPPRAKKHFMTQDERDYLEGACKAPDGTVTVPPRQRILELLTNGVSSGNIHPDVTYDAARSFLRSRAKDR